jgi:prepilin-type N-terminal cleavage/methylation domain-containing protein
MKIMKNLKSNKGFTLIEILVVLALIGVSMGVIGISSSSSSMNNLRKCTNAANSLLSRCRINSMYRAEPVFIELTVSGGNIVGRYIERAFNEEDEEATWRTEEQILGRANIEVLYFIEGEDEPRNIAHDPLRVGFTRRGALVLVDAEGMQLAGEPRLDEIRFTNGSITYVIDIIPETGNRRVRAG